MKKTGAGANTDPKLTLIRKAMTGATTSTGIGGRPKSRGGKKPVTLAGATKGDEKRE